MGKVKGAGAVVERDSRTSVRLAVQAMMAKRERAEAARWRWEFVQKLALRMKEGDAFAEDGGE